MEAQSQKTVLKKENDLVPSPSLKVPSKLIFTVTTGTASSTASPSTSSPALPAKQQAQTPSALLVPRLASTGIVLMSAQHSSSLHKPPPLIATSKVPQGVNATIGATITSIPSLSLAGKLAQKLEPVTVQTPGRVETQVVPGPSTPKSSTGGLGAGKPKAFLALMTSSTKKQSKKTPPGAAKASKGQGNKNKASPSSSVLLKKPVDQAPSRTSNRSIKRPRTYDEECDDQKALKPLLTKKIKGTPKVSETSQQI